MIIAAMQHPDLPTRDLSSVRGVFSGGAQVPEALVRGIEDTLGVDFTIIYGQTECSPVLTNTFPTDTAEDKGQTVGPPLPHTEVRIVDPVSLETVPIGERGELWARGYFTMIEYFDKPAETADTPVARRLVAHGRPRDDGRARLLPHRWPPQGHDHPRRREPLPRGDRRGALPPSRGGRGRRGRSPRREVGRGRGGVPSSCGRGSPAEGRRAAAYLREHLSPQKTPSQWFLVDEFPLTGSGKVQKFAIREAWEKGLYDQAPLGEA